MKKLLSLVLVLALCGVAGAGLLELKVASVGQSKTGTTAITPTKEIGIYPSDWVGMDIYYTAPLDPVMLLVSVSVELKVSGPGTIDLVTEHKTKTGTAGIMQLTERVGAWDKDLRWINVLSAGKDIIIDYQGSGLYGEDDPVIALGHIMFHLEGIGPVTITMTNTTNSYAANTLEIDPACNIYIPSFGGPVTIQDIPEPATIALLPWRSSYQEEISII